MSHFDDLMRDIKAEAHAEGTEELWAEAEAAASDQAGGKTVRHVREDMDEVAAAQKASTR